MNTVRDILRQKGAEVWSVPPHATVYTALELMAKKGIGAVMVVENEHPIGIFTERHYAREVALKGKRSHDTPVGDLMTTKVVCTRPEHGAEDAMALMTDKRVRHLPVMDEDRMVGIVSIGDVVKAVISKREFLIEQLENYITRG